MVHKIVCKFNDKHTKTVPSTGMSLALDHDDWPVATFTFGPLTI